MTSENILKNMGYTKYRVLKTCVVGDIELSYVSTGRYVNFTSPKHFLVNLKDFFPNVKT